MNARRIGKAACVWVAVSATVVLLIAPGGPAAATTYHVPGDHAAIQEAMNAATHGDTILVGLGLYEESVSFQGKAVSLRSTDGPEATTIDPPGRDRAVDIAGAGAEIIGFTITGAYARGPGSGVQTHGAGSLIEGCIFDGNIQATGYHGAAIGGNVSSPIIRGNIFRNNDADDQWSAGVVSFINGSSPVIENNVFEDNTCRALFLHLPSSGNPTVINNTFVRNDSAINGGVGTYRNNIVVDNGVGVSGGFATFENHLVYGNDTDYANTDLTGTAGNISADPRFVDPLGDYRLLFGSPAIDAGSAAGAPLDDILGQPRPIDGDGDTIAAFDIGAYEYVPEPATLSLLALGGLAVVRRRRRRGRRRRAGKAACSAAIAAPGTSVRSTPARPQAAGSCAAGSAATAASGAADPCLPAEGRQVRPAGR